MRIEQLYECTGCGGIGPEEAIIRDVLENFSEIINGRWYTYDLLIEWKCPLCKHIFQRVDRR